MRFDLRYDRMTRIVTPLCLILLIATFLFTLLGGGDMSSLPRYLSAGGILLILLACIAWAPRCYQVQDGNLEIQRMMIGPVRIPLSSIQSVSAISKKALKGSVRTFGAGAFLGYFGKFYHPDLGRMNWYATDLNTAVLLRTRSGKTYLLSPAERDQFLRLLKADQSAGSAR